MDPTITGFVAVSWLNRRIVVPNRSSRTSTLTYACFTIIQTVFPLRFSLYMCRGQAPFPCHDKSLSLRLLLKLPRLLSLVCYKSRHFQCRKYMKIHDNLRENVLEIILNIFFFYLVLKSNSRKKLSCNYHLINKVELSVLFTLKILLRYHWPMKYYKVSFEEFWDVSIAPPLYKLLWQIESKI
jgi:hypothetical protein